MKKQIGVFVFLTAMLALSTAASGLDNALTLHIRIAGDKNDFLTLFLEKMSEDKTSVTVKFTDVDMALFQYNFAIATVVKYVEFTVTEIGPGYYVVNIAQKDLKQNGLNEYTMTLPHSVLKKNTDTTSLTQYQGAELLLVKVYAQDKYLRTFVANMDVDIAAVNLDEGYMDVLVSYNGLVALYLAGFQVEVVADMSGDVGTFELEPEYYTYPEVVTELSQIQTAHSSIAKVISLGTSYQSRDIVGIKISDNVQTEESEPEIFICALHHAREAATVNVAMYIINQLTDKYGTDQTVTNLVNSREIYIFPVINPDGKVYDDSGGTYGNGRNWRKNRQPCSGGTGTDLNRNYSYMWGGSGSSGTCTSDTYRGPSAFSAPETARVRDFFNAHPDINVLLTYHSYGALILWPWGYTYSAISDANDKQVHINMGNGYKTYVGYTAQQASALYLASGTTDDWGYGVTQNHAMPCFSFTIELSGSGFYPPPSVLPTMCANNYLGALYFIDCADNPYKVLGAYVKITNPLNSSTVSGTVLSTTVTSGVDSVKFYIDGSLKYTDTTAPFEWSWNTTGYSNGSHTIKAEGYSGTTLKSTDQNTVTVQNSASTALLSLLVLFLPAGIILRRS